MPAHQRPPMRELGRRSEAAAPVFRTRRADDGGGGGGAPAMPALFGTRPMILLARTGQRDVVTAACPVALDLGLRPGMAAAQARALVADLDVRDAAPDADREILDRLALHAVRHWTPTAAVAGDDGLWLDLTGTTHLFGGEARFCRRLSGFLRRLGLTARIAIAGTPGAAHALARFGGEDVLILPEGREGEALALLPLAALRLDPQALAAAARFGIERIADLYLMPRGPLARRLGRAAVERLDQARGHVLEPIVAVVPFDMPRAERRLFEPITTAEAISQVIGDLLGDMGALLERRGLGLRTAVLRCERVDAAEQYVSVGTARATRDIKHLKRLFALRIDRIEPGLGIEAMELAAPQVEPLAPQTIVSGFAADRAPDIAPIVDQLVGRAGEAALFRVGAVESDVPERALRRAAPLARPAGWPEWTRPARLLSSPEALRGVVALLPDHPPRRFAWRGRDYRVVAGDGPERIHGEWWRSSREMWAVRDYFRVEAESGERFWLFRRGDAVEDMTGDLSWYMHGVFG
ncbi:MAG: DNA polymerase Y family protein [Sphingomonadales bacterium]|nr:MAG: DNA polymerase Y family protein [Sphingomonadales bacterium]